MRNAYGINITDGRDDGRIDAEPFLLRSASELLVQEQEQVFAEQSAIRAEKQSFVGKKLFSACFPKKRKALDEQSAEIQKRADRLFLSSHRELGIPDGAPAVDVFCLAYTEKKGKRKDAIGAYVPLSVRIFREGNMLCLGSVDSVLGVSLSAIYDIRQTRGRALFTAWTKTEPFDSERYRSFGVRQEKKGFFSVDATYSLRFATTLGDFEIVIPAYDVMPFLALTGRAPITG